MLSFFFVCAVLFHLYFVWCRVVSQSCTSTTRYTRYYTAVRRVAYLACNYTERVLLPLLIALLCVAMLLLVIVCWTANIIAGSFNLILIQCFLSLHSNTIYFYVRLGSTVAFTASIHPY